MNTTNNPDFLQFLAGYTEALYWSSSDELDGEYVNLDEFEASTAAGDKCRADCLAFFEANRADITEAADLYPTREEHGGFALAGHDFALTRNGHGAGFWDGDLPEELGERLTEASETSGAVELYLGEDQLIYIC
jgi:hypothetical protein